MMRQERANMRNRILPSPKAAKVHNRGWPNEVREPTANRKQTMRPRRGRTYFVLAIFLMFALFEDASSLFIVRRLTAFGCFASGYEPSPPSATQTQGLEHFADNVAQELVCTALPLPEQELDNNNSNQLVNLSTRQLRQLNHVKLS